MNNLIIYLFSAIIFYCCASNTTEKDQNSQDHLINHDTIKVDSGFGCIQLITNPLPDRWAVVPYWEYEHDEEGEVTNLNRYDRQYYDIVDCFKELNSHNDSIRLPKIHKWTYVASGIENFCSCGTTHHISTPMIANYRLSRIGPYQLYYSYQTAGYAEKCAFDCLQLGRLILVNNDSSSAKLIPIYYHAPAQFTVIHRIFYLQKNKIKLWQYQVREDSTLLKSRIQLSIMENGEIVKQDY